MGSVLTRGIFLVCLVFGGARPLLAATSEQVESAISRAKAFLYSQQNADGSWEKFPKDKKWGNVPFWGGHTALVTYALLAAGENEHDPRLAKGIAFLKNENIRLTYAVGLRAQAWLFLHDKAEARRLAGRDAKMLLTGADAKGRYDYDAGDWRVRNERPHNSTSQYGVLGMWAASQLGFEVPTTYWQKVEAGWKECQGPAGSWTYFPVIPQDASKEVRVAPTPQMTVAGIASLLIAQEYLYSGVACKGNVQSEPIDRGLKWLADHWPAGSNYSYLQYGIERVGLMSGLKYIGTHDWYQEGADLIVRTQQPDGNWPDSQGMPLVDAPLKLIFLARGRAPVVINKLAYDIDDNGQRKTGPWAQRPRDCWNLVNWMDSQLEARLNWQVVNINTASREDLLDAPVLLICGNKPLSFTPPQLEKLRQFVQDGGLILGNSDCGSEEFTRSFTELGTALFPRQEFRILPEDHPIFTRGQVPMSKWRTKLRLRGLSNGVREVMLLPEADISKSMQMHEDSYRSENYELAKSVFLYTTDKTGVQASGKMRVVKPDPTVATTALIKIARIQYAGNWDPEPGGWRRLATVMRNDYKVDLQIKNAKLNNAGLLIDDEKPMSPDELRKLAMARIKPEEFQATGGDTEKMAALISAKTAEVRTSLEASQSGGTLPITIAHLTGTGKAELLAQERSGIKKFVESGGTLLIDCAGGNAEFATSIEAVLGEVFGADTVKQLKDPLPVDHPIYRAGMAPVEKFGYRPFTREKVTGMLRTPLLRGITLNGRLAVVFSREDLSGGLVGQQVDGIIGYDPETATAIVEHILLSTSGWRPPPTPVSQGKPITASSQFAEPGYGPGNAVDGNPKTRWASDYAARSGWLEVDLGDEVEIDRVLVSEIEWPETREFTIEIKQGEQWNPVANGTTIGASKEISFAPVKARYVRLNVTKAELPININEFQVFAHVR